MKWEEKTLDELGSVSRGKSRFRPRNAPHLYGGKYPFIQTADVKRANLYLTNYSQTYSEAGLAQSKLWDKETLCITIAANIAEVSILKIKACFPDSIIGFIADKSICDVRYIKYYFDIFQKTFQQISQGSTQDNLSASKLLSLKIPTPPLKTQKKIAKILSNYDNLIENNLKQIELLEERARLTYEEWFLRFKVDGVALEIDSESGLPFGWKREKIGNFIDTSSGGTPNKKHKEYYDNGNIPWVRTKELKNFMLIQSEEYITELGLKKSSAKLFPKNTVLLAMYGNTIGEVTFSTFETSTNQACCAFIIDKKEEYLSYYIHQYLLNNKVKVLSYRMGAAQENISQKIIKEMIIELPDNKTLQSFGNKLKLFYKQIENLTLQNQNLKEARDILLPRLMTGVIEP